MVSFYDEMITRLRQVFISYHLTCRGHAYCAPFSEIKENVPEYIKKEDNWFYILRYNPESRYVLMCSIIVWLFYNTGKKVKKLSLFIFQTSITSLKKRREKWKKIKIF